MFAATISVKSGSNPMEGISSLRFPAHGKFFLWMDRRLDNGIDNFLRVVHSDHASGVATIIGGVRPYRRVCRPRHNRDNANGPARPLKRISSLRVSTEAEDSGFGS